MMFFSLAILFFAYIINAQTPPSAAPPTAPSPPVSTCANIGGYDVTSASGATRVYHWQPSSETSTVSFSVCGSINTICGEPGQICSTEPSNCCGMCQSWSEADGTVGTCLGKFSTSRFINGAVEVQYDNGDPVKDNNPAGRRGILNIRCGSGASNFPIEAVHFTQASTHEPNEPYVYVLDTTSPLVCGGIGAGGWILIIMFCFLLPGYLIGGFLANKFYFMKEHEGSFLEYLPNYEFWVDSPKLFLEGCSFTKQRFMALIGKEEY